LEPPEDLAVLLRVELEVPDVGNAASGATGARVAQEIFEALGIDRAEQFNVAMKGENSLRTWGPIAQRWREEGNPILRHVGRKIEDGVVSDTKLERTERSEARLTKGQ
jgi:hypothetical protein